VAEIRDYNEVKAEQLAVAEAAVQAAMSSAADQQVQAKVWVDTGLSGDLREGRNDLTAT
jgi:hypothetical protein